MLCYIFRTLKFVVQENFLKKNEDIHYLMVKKIEVLLTQNIIQGMRLGQQPNYYG